MEYRLFGGDAARQRAEDFAAKRGKEWTVRLLDTKDAPFFRFGLNQWGQLQNAGARYSHVAMRNVYRVERYSRDATTLVWGKHLSLQEARDLVRKHLRVSRLTKSRLWFPPDEMGGGEAYHDTRPSHPNADGCGGLHIVPEGC